MPNTHLDFSQLVVVKAPHRPTTVTGTGHAHLHIEDKKATPWDKIGPAQRESLLAFIVSREIEDTMAHAEGDNIVYDALGSHRILGPQKKRKGRITSATK